jgi:hypothetical protein
VIGFRAWVACFFAAGDETLLVFDARQPMIATMAKPWYRRLFSDSQKSAPETTTFNADPENADVQFGLGLKFASSGVAQDFAQAADWYRKAADQSHALAQFNLAMMYAQGQGVARSDAESVIWFGKAARQGDAGAQFHLGKSCHRASLRGVPEQTTEARIEAYKWFHLAAAQGYRGSVTACTPVILGMTHADVAVAERRVASFVAGNSKPAEA